MCMSSHFGQLVDPMSSKMGLQVYLKWLLHSEEPRDRAVSACSKGRGGNSGSCEFLTQTLGA